MKPIIWLTTIAWKDAVIALRSSSMQVNYLPIPGLFHLEFDQRWKVMTNHFGFQETAWLCLCTYGRLDVAARISSFV